MASVSSLQGPLEQASAARHDRKTRSHAYLVRRGLGLNMANNPKKVKDPTEVALSAIQEALNISDASAPEESQGSMRNDGAPPSMPSGTPSFENYDMRPGASQDRQALDRQAFDAIDPPPLIARRPANDDRE